jgi:serine/threonine-protein kinase
MRGAELRASFAREARIAASVRHANVAAVLDVEEHGEGPNGEVTLILEYVEGASLAELIRSREPISVAAAGRILLDVARGLHAAHETRDAAGEPLDIVHRDVTPHNVLVGIDGVARISDFGVAKATAGALADETRSTTLKGKLAYMAPEYLQTGSCDRRADVFSLGVIAWELFAGQRLFRAEGEFETMLRVMEAEIPPPSRANPRLPPGLDEVVLGALARDTALRFPSALAWARALEASLHQAGSIAGPDEVLTLVEQAVGPMLSERRQAIRSALRELSEAASPRPLPGRPMDETTVELARTRAPEVDVVAPRTPPRFDTRARGAPWLRYVAVALALCLSALWWLASTRDSTRAAEHREPAPSPVAETAPYDDNAEPATRGDTHAAPAPARAVEPPEKPPLRQPSRRSERLRERKVEPTTTHDTAPPNPYRKAPH